MRITTKIGGKSVKTVRSEKDKCWSVMVYSYDGKFMMDFGALFSSNLKDMGANHIKMVKKVVNNTSYYSKLGHPPEFHNSI